MQAATNSASGYLASMPLVFATAVHAIKTPGELVREAMRRSRRAPAVAIA